MSAIPKVFIALATLLCLHAHAGATPMEDLAAEVQAHNHNKTSGWVLQELVTFEIGDKCWAKVLDKKTGITARLAGHARGIERYAAVVTGNDWAKIELRDPSATDANRAEVQKLITEFKPKFHLTVRVEGDDCVASGSGMWVKYMGNALVALGKYPPKSGSAFVTIKAAATAKKVTAEVAKDGKTITMTGPRDSEEAPWADIVEKALKRVTPKG